MKDLKRNLTQVAVDLSENIDEMRGMLEGASPELRDNLQASIAMSREALDKVRDAIESLEKA